MHVAFGTILQGESNSLCPMNAGGHHTHQQSPFGSPLTSLQIHLSSAMDGLSLAAPTLWKVKLPGEMRTLHVG